MLAITFGQDQDGMCYLTHHIITNEMKIPMLVAVPKKKKKNIKIKRNKIYIEMLISTNGAC